MALGVNSTLITSAHVTTVAFNNTNDDIDIGVGVAQTPNTQADAVYFGNGTTADDSINGFGKNDSILNFQKIFDGNNDGIVNFGVNGVLDIDRTTTKAAGEAQITVTGMLSGALRYLGAKEGYHVYADASVRLAGQIEGTVGNDSFNAAGGNKTYLYDTALGLNLGGDTITGFGVGDRIATTTKLFDGNHDGIITFSSNNVLDLPGELDGFNGNTGPVLGGQIQFAGSPTVTGLVLISDSVVADVHYYYYGVAVPL